VGEENSRDRFNGTEEDVVYAPFIRARWWLGAKVKEGTRKKAEGTK